MLVAVYGSLRKGLGNYNYHLKTSKYLGVFETAPIFTLKDLGSFPGLLKNGNTSVTMEVFRINSDVLESLDRLEGYYNKSGQINFYNREKIDTPYGEAFVYFYNEEDTITDAPIVTSGDWKEFLANHKLYQNA